MSERSFFVTGTDTGVGKTVVAAVLTAKLRARGYDVVPMKPVQTGEADDLAVSLRAADLTVDEAERKRMCPYRFALAASPHLAAAREGVTISIDRIRRACEELRARHDGVMVEGAGGALTPLTDSRSMLDVMTALRLPVMIVARPGLGTLNHTLLTIRELRRAKLDVRAVFLNETNAGSWGEIEEDNLQTLQRVAEVPTIVRFPFVANPACDLPREVAMSLMP
ncbi:MAG: dethiobiotin synthase [bacterium]